MKLIALVGKKCDQKYSLFKELKIILCGKVYVQNMCMLILFEML